MLLPILLAANASIPNLKIAAAAAAHFFRSSNTHIPIINLLCTLISARCNMGEYRILDQSLFFCFFVMGLIISIDMEKSRRDNQKQEQDSAEDPHGMKQAHACGALEEARAEKLRHDGVRPLALAPRS
jgi:hypothetical protein